MEQHVKEKYEASVELAKKIQSSEATVSDKARAQTYADMITKKIGMIEDFDGRREKWVADLEEYSGHIARVAKKQEEPAETYPEGISPAGNLTSEPTPEKTETTKEKPTIKEKPSKDTEEEEKPERTESQ